MGNQLTAIATELVFCDKRKFFRKYKLLKGEFHATNLDTVHADR